MTATNDMLQHTLLAVPGIFLSGLARVHLLGPDVPTTLFPELAGVLEHHGVLTLGLVLVGGAGMLAELALAEAVLAAIFTAFHDLGQSLGFVLQYTMISSDKVDTTRQLPDKPACAS
eukprot:TRINITY_DN12119_c0_g3_i2.p3 TRINITY_DN12119_c0_g3~~TRINITY_DN12119_c0_g3_i2.p3  ORF type:complete len:117 (+),score=12.04 TRINITY_DN12119_c0_g3_i2:762-1112(+)